MNSRNAGTRLNEGGEVIWIEGSPRDKHGRRISLLAQFVDGEIVRLGPIEHPTLRIDGVPVCIGDTVETSVGFRGVVDEIHTCSLRFLHNNGWPVTADPGVCRLVRFAGEEQDRPASEHVYGAAVDTDAALPRPPWEEPGQVEWQPVDPHTTLRDLIEQEEALNGKPSAPPPYRAVQAERDAKAIERAWANRRIVTRADLYAQLRAEVAALDLPGVDVTTDMVGAEALIEVRAHGQRAEIVARPYCGVWHAGVDRVPDWIRGVVAAWDAEAGARVRRESR